MKPQNSLVLGIGMGDEGKGLVTDWLCSPSMSNNKKLVIRFSGGQQAGHTVYNNDIKHVFSNFGSGTLRGIPSAFMETCTIDPIGILNELSVLKSKGIQPLLYIHKNCPITTMYDKLYNKKQNQRTKHGSVGVGVGATFNREENHYSLTFGDLFFRPVYTFKFNIIKNWYNKKFFIDTDEKSEMEFHEAVMDLISLDCILPFQEQYEITGMEDLIFEGSQGLLLDPSIGFFPYVTRSNLLPVGYPIDQVYLVTRAYQTRHGNGPLSNEKIPNNIMDNPFETNITNYQGVFRKSILDLDLLLYAIDKAGIYKKFKRENRNLIITCLDHIQNEYRYTKAGIVHACANENEFISEISSSLSIPNIYISHSPYSEKIKLWKA